VFEERTPLVPKDNPPQIAVAQSGNECRISITLHNPYAYWVIYHIEWMDHPFDEYPYNAQMAGGELGAGGFYTYRAPCGMWTVSFHKLDYDYYKTFEERRNGANKVVIVPEAMNKAYEKWLNSD
jgi:hypothetical protein